MEDNSLIANNHDRSVLPRVDRKILESVLNLQKDTLYLNPQGSPANLELQLPENVRLKQIAHQFHFRLIHFNQPIDDPKKPGCKLLTLVGQSLYDSSAHNLLIHVHLIKDSPLEKICDKHLNYYFVVKNFLATELGNSPTYIFSKRKFVFPVKLT